MRLKRTKGRLTTEAKVRVLKLYIIDKLNAKEALEDIQKTCNAPVSLDEPIMAIENIRRNVIRLLEKRSDAHLVKLLTQAGLLGLLEEE